MTKLTGPISPPSRPGRLLALVTAVLLVGLAVVAPDAWAHGDDGVLRLVSATPSGTSSVITVELTYENDGEPVAAATVTVAGDNGAGLSLTPVNLQPGATAGVFTGAVAFPASGTWNLRVTSVKPAAELTLTQDIATDQPATTATAPTSLAPSTTSGSVVPELAAGSSTSPDDESGTSPVWWILGGIAVVVCVGLGVVFVARGRNQGPID